MGSKFSRSSRVTSYSNNNAFKRGKCDVCNEIIGYPSYTQYLRNRNQNGGHWEGSRPSQNLLHFLCKKCNTHANREQILSKGPQYAWR